MKICAAILAFFIVIIGRHGLLNAQQPVQPLRDQLILASQRNYFLKVTLLDGSGAEGRLRNVETTTIAVGSHRIALDSIASFDRRIRRDGGGRRGAVIGAVSCFVLTLPLRGFVSDSDSGGSASDANLLSGGSIVVGGLIGMLAGEAVNPGKASWVHVWP